MKVPIICLTLLLFCLDCVAQQKIILAAEGSWPPYADVNGNGISKRLIIAALHGTPFEPEFIAVPYARALEMTEHGHVDGCFNVTRQRDTEQRFLFGKQVLLTATASYFYPLNAARAYGSPEDIPNNTKIAVIIGYEYGDVYERNRHRFEELRVSSQSQIISLLQNNRVDMAIMFDEVAKFTLANMGLNQATISKGKMNHSSDIYVAFSRNRQGVATIIDALDMGLEKMKARGENLWLDK